MLGHPLLLPEVAPTLAEEVRLLGVRALRVSRHLVVASRLNTSIISKTASSVGDPEPDPHVFGPP